MKQSRVNFGQSKGYSLIAKTLHWGFVGLFAYGVIKQVNDVSELSNSALLRFEILFAAGFSILLALRFLYMRFTQTSALPQSTSPWQKLAAKLVHYGLYLSFGSIAASGLFIGALYSYGVTQGLLMNSVIALHEASVTASYYLIAVHVLAAIYHRLLGDRVWSAMVPLWRE